jgi:drug/metabolite transporter (DMT)-like permease
MLALALALAAGISWGGADFVGGLMTRRLSPARVLLVSQSVGLVFTGVLVLVLHEPVPPLRYWLIGVGGGLSASIGLAALYRGLAVGPMSIVAPIASLSVIPPVVVGFLEGDAPAATQLVGMALAAGGVALAARASDEPARPSAESGALTRADGPRLRSGLDGRPAPGRLATGIGLALTAALFLGLLVVSLDKAGEGGTAWAVFIIRLTSAPIFLAAVAFSGDRRRPARGDVGTLIFLGLFDNAANVLFALASQRGLLSLVAVLGSLYPVSTVLLARTLLRERLSRAQTVGVLAAFAGVALIAVG